MSQMPYGNLDHLDVLEYTVTTGSALSGSLLLETYLVKSSGGG